MKKLLGIVVIGLFVFLVIFYLIQNNNCRFLSHFASDDCFSLYKIKRDIANKLVKYPTLNKIAREFNNKILNKKYEFKENIQPRPESTSITPSLYNKNEILIEAPFIKGIANSQFEKKENSIPKNLEVAVIGSGAGGGIAANLLNQKYEVGIFDKGHFPNGETNNETF